MCKIQMEWQQHWQKRHKTLRIIIKFTFKNSNLNFFDLFYYNPTTVVPHEGGGFKLDVKLISGTTCPFFSQNRSGGVKTL
jgi:hypothetical protein